MTARIFPSNITRRVLSLLTASLFVLSAAAVITAQEKPRTVERTPFFKEPLEFVEVRGGGETIEFDKAFFRAGDWLENFTIVIRNKHDHPIVYVSVALDFNETRATGNGVTFPLGYGINPLTKAKKEGEPPVPAGDTVELKLTPQKYEALKKFLAERHQLADLTRVALRIELIIYEDGKGWSGGNFMRPDPSTPGRYIPILD